MADESIMIGDGLGSFTAGLGTDRDKSFGIEYNADEIDDSQLLAAYRSSWLARKIVDIPALDSFRQWRDWQAENIQIEEIEEEEKRLSIKAKQLRARRLARLFGTAYIYFDVPGKPDQPVDLTRMKKGCIRFATVFNHNQLTPGEFEDDPLSPEFGKPKWYDVVGAKQGMVRIHPSRLIVHIGAERPEPTFLAQANARLGDSVLIHTMDAIKQFDGTAANIASLVYEANVDVIKVAGLMTKVGNPKEEQRLLQRYKLAATTKGNNGMLILDKENEEYERKAYTFAALSDIMDRFGQNSSGAADIPVTRLFGKSPGGMNATGDSDLKNYYDRIRSTQELEIQPAMAIFDECLIWSAIGDRPEEIHYVWGSLWQITETEKAALGKTKVDTIKTMADTGLFPEEVLAKSAVAMLTEDAIIPGLEAEYDRFYEEGGEAPWDEAERKEQEALEAGMSQVDAKGNPIPPNWSGGGSVPPSGGKQIAQNKPKKFSDEFFGDMDQPRVPKGSPKGGQFASKNSGGQSAGEDGKWSAGGEWTMSEAAAAELSNLGLSAKKANSMQAKFVGMESANLGGLLSAKNSHLSPELQGIRKSVEEKMAWKESDKAAWIAKKEANAAKKAAKNAVDPDAIDVEFESLDDFPADTKPAISTPKPKLIDYSNMDEEQIKAEYKKALVESSNFSGDLWSEDYSVLSSNVKNASNAYKEKVLNKTLHNKPVGQNSSYTEAKGITKKFQHRDDKSIASEFGIMPHTESQTSVASYADLSSDESKSIAIYTGSQYKSINNQLRNGTDNGHDYEIKQIDRAIAKHSLKEDTTFIRGITYSGMSKILQKSGGSLEPGDVLIDPGYFSMTRKVSVAKNFSGKDGYAMIIKAKKGQAVAPVKIFSEHPHEDEFLSMRSTRLKVVSFDDEARIAIFEMV